MKKIKPTMLWAIASCLLVLSCNGQPSEIASNNKKITYSLVASGLQNPWGMAFLPNGDILVTEKAGSIRIVRDGTLLDQQITGVPSVYDNGQGGLLDIVLHPDFDKNHWLYLSYASTDGGGSGGNTAIARFELKGTQLTNQKILYKATPNTTKRQHFGSRMAFDPDGYLYFTIGDRGNRDVNPQNINLDGGKVYRITDEGKIPADNPFVGQGKAKQAIYSYGHRNPQGLAVHPQTGRVWEHEHGPKGGDEVNLIAKGKNYGWPVISYGVNYSGTKFTDITAKEGMEQPVVYWVPSIAPCGMTFVSGDRYPGWQGDLIVGSLKFGYLVHATVRGDTIVAQEKIAEGIGRVRNVAQGPDGYIYVGVEGKGLYRLEHQ